MATSSTSTVRPLQLAEVERISILGSESIVCGFHLVDFIWTDIFANLSRASTYVLITDTNLAALYLEKYKESFAVAWAHHQPEKPAPRLLVHVLPPGETSKSRATKGAIEDWMLEQRCTRDTLVVALGGGVIGDLVGFVAATFMRGVPFVQVPTSLLAMVDSSIGGKTAVDTPAGKNLIGAFWQPQRIFMDMAVLSTLPAREFSNGMAEVVKTAAIWTATEFDVLEEGAEDIRAAVLDGQREGTAGLTVASRTPAQALLLRVIAASARVKAHVVTHDERESGMRGLLNFGHTIGHAIEAVLAPQVLHGECVAVGCVLEAEVARRMGHLSPVAVARLARCLRAYGLPTAMDDPLLLKRAGAERMRALRPERLMRVMAVDKKTVGAQKRLVVLSSLGSTLEMKPTSVSDALIAEAVSVGVCVSPVSTQLHAEVTVVPPGSKSISNRALLLAALGQGQCRIRNLLHSDDTQVMLAALQALGACTVAWEDGGDTLLVTGNGGQLHRPDTALFLGNAGTAARFLSTTAVLVNAKDGNTVLTGNSRMKQRPIGPLVDALRANGCEIEYCEGEGSLPLRVAHSGSGLPGGHIQLAASVSSQYVSSILLCAPYAQQPVRLELVGGKVISQPYIDMTIAMMAQFGVHVERLAENEYMIPTGTYTNPTEYVVESDASSATYPLAFAAITGTQCTVPNIGSASLQGDARFAVDVLRPMGCTVTQTETSTTVAGPPRGQLHALPDIDMEPMTDAFLTAAALAAVATGSDGRVTRIRGIANQHVKECDRIAAMCAELARFGVEAENHPDGIDVHARSIAELKDMPSIHCYDDHRVAMSLSILACVAPGGAEIRERRCVGKTWPHWWDVLTRDLGVPLVGSDPEAEAVPASERSSSSASIVLIGMRGVGKTTLGRAAARALNLQFVDLDELLERETGQSIPEIINSDGWPAFRAHETRVLRTALTDSYRTGTVIACGGGVVESAENRSILRAHVSSHDGDAAVICLTPNMDHVAEYLGRDKTRPAYAVTSDIHEVYARRLPLYAESCNYEYLVDKALVSGTAGAGADSAWGLVEREFIRLVRFATRRDLNHVPLDRPSYFVSLTAPSVSEYLPSKLAAITAGAQAIEMRADLLLRHADFADVDLQSADVAAAFTAYVHAQFTLLRHNSRLPVVFTVRTEPQGGAFPSAADELRLKLLRSAIQWGAEYVDVEIDAGNSASSVMAARQNSLIIASYHDPSGKQLRWDSEFALEILARARSSGNIAKLISHASTWEDNLKCQQFVQQHHSASTPLIALNMGFAGQMSRILCPCLTPVTHPLLTAAAAPGQISVRQINQARSLMGLLPTQQFYLFGTPIQHSPSPAMHNAAFAALGLPHTYELKETPGVDELRLVIADPLFGGASVTIPHKQTIIPLLDELSPAAQRIGAVNTLVVSSENNGQTRKLLGDNTDYLGIMGCLRQAQMETRTPEFTSSSALVIGAGGTSRAALYALHALGIPKCALYNRTLEKAQALACEFESLFESLEVVDSLERAAEDICPSYIVGTIPASDLYLPEQLFAQPGVALDMAYKPRWTPLLEAANRRKWGVVHGVSVLIEQGIHQMELWTNAVAPAKCMGDAVLTKYNSEF
ncbi:3-dehydroquinate dehydratase (3-dehydroquinase) [Coemansia sp. RSA 1086]|nr:3-dehydroquinate dehydratase (3-dehydroquinase) [Coemansia sp. RSA 1086]